MMDGTISYRELQPEDWAVLGPLLGRSSDELAGLRRQIEAEFDPWFAFIAEDAAEHTPAGVIFGGAPRTPQAPPVEAIGPQREPRVREARILWIEVAPAYRRSGIGRRLLDAALDEWRRRQYGRITLLVEGTQVEALALFRRRGFEVESESLGLVLPPAAGAALAGTAPSPAAGAVVRPLGIDDVPLLAGLLITLGIERAETRHDDLPALSPVVVADWLQRPGTLAYAAWERGDPKTPVGLAWATRRTAEAVLRFVGVQEEVRRRGIGRALISAIAGATRAPGQEPLPLRAQVHRAGPVQAFFRRVGFVAEHVTYQMVLALAPAGEIVAPAMPIPPEVDQPSRASSTSTSPDQGDSLTD